MKNKFNLNLWIDLVLFLSVASVSITGFVINYIMPPCIAHRYGVEGLVRYNKSIRHFWGDIHMVAGVVLIVLLTLHIILHRQAISAFFTSHIPNKIFRRIVYVLLTLLLLATITPWIFANYLFL